MLYKSVILGATGASCAMVKAAKDANAAREVRKRMFASGEVWLEV
jgi:hypothetical protein